VRPPPVVPDLLGANLLLVFCGTAPSRVSKERQAYYANPGNGFWKTLHRAGLTDKLFAPHEYAQLRALGIGFTDVNKSEWGNDDELTPAGFDVPGLIAKLRRWRPARIAFTSKTAASHVLGRGTGHISYGRQPERLGTTEVFVMPSTSGHAVRYFDIAPWRELARIVNLSRG